MKDKGEDPILELGITKCHQHRVCVCICVYHNHFEIVKCQFTSCEVSFTFYQGMPLVEVQVYDPIIARKLQKSGRLASDIYARMIVRKMQTPQTTSIKGHLVVTI